VHIHVNNIKSFPFTTAGLLNQPKNGCLVKIITII